MSYKPIRWMQTVFFFALIVGALATNLDGADTRPIPAATVVDSIVVIKHSRKMMVYEHGALVKTYAVALGRNPVGTKQYQGDMRTPEGLYRINDRNPGSTCHKNLGISYPNDADRKRAERLGKSPGGDIKIHGLPNGQGAIGTAHVLHDWTYGCIAVTDAEIDELYAHVRLGATINILP